jgi:hypothetical protein
MKTLKTMLVSAAFGLTAAASAAPASAQATPIPEAITVGDWTFRPLLEVRVRGEYRRHPFDAGGLVYGPAPVLYEDYGSTLPKVAASQPEVANGYQVAERSRLGLAIDRGPVTAQITLQDARMWGSAGAGLVPSGQPERASFAPYEAYLDVHTRSGRKVFFRAGRQAVSWGDGRLLGSNDWSATGRSLDAARFGFQVGDLDVEMFAAMLAVPGRYLDPVDLKTLREGSGAQLYGLDAVYHVLPLLNIEAMGLMRMVRDPAPATLTPSTIGVIDGRIFGDRRGFRYAVEGAYELGKVAWYGANRDVRAFAFAARVSWETALPGHLTFGAEGAYASGDDGTVAKLDNKTGKVPTLKRFDPILPDEHSFLGPMGLFAWSNLMFVGGDVGVQPIDELRIKAGYHLAALAQPGGRWTDAALTPIGAAPGNTSRALGHEIDASLKITPWKPFEIDAGYGIFLRGTGADEVLLDAQRQAKLQHWAYLQTTVRLP